MKVLLTSHQFFPKYGSGTEVLTRDTGFELLKRGHEVHVLTTDPGLRVDSDDVSYEDYEYGGLKVRSLGIPAPPSGIVNVRREYDNELVARHVRRYLEEVAPDVAHVFHAARLSGSIIDVFKRQGMPVVFTPTDFWAICVRNTLMKPSGELSEGPDDISSNCLECREVERLLPATHILRKSMSRDKKEFHRKTAERALARRKWEHPSMEVVREILARTRFLRGRVNSVDAILAPTKLMQRMLTQNGIDRNLVRHSPYGMDISRFRAPESSENGFSDSVRAGSVGLRLGYVGTIHPQKGVHVLIEAFKSLPWEANVTLRLCGSFAHFPEYSREIFEMARTDPRINLAGTFPNEKIAEEMKKIDVLVVPSTWYENTPLVIYSAFAAKIPVVATDLGGMAEVVRHEDNGLLFAPGDAGDLARQLHRLMDEPDSLKRYAGNVGNVRSVEDSVNEMLELYGRLLREKKPLDLTRARDASRTPEDWLWLNNVGLRKDPELKEFAAPFPPEGLRRLPHGQVEEPEFASYGVGTLEAMTEFSTVLWERPSAVLDHGCRAGPVARLIEPLGASLSAVDAAGENVDWVRANLPRIEAQTADPDRPLPYADECFDAAYSLFEFTRGDAARHRALLADLSRVSKPGAPIFVAVYGEWALGRFAGEPGLRERSGVVEEALREAAEAFGRGEHATAPARDAATGDLTDLAFVPAPLVRGAWTEWFDLVSVKKGEIGDLQDLVVLAAKAERPSPQEIEALREEGPDARPDGEERTSRISEHWARNVRAR